MITLFTVIAIINALLLVNLIILIYLKQRTANEIDFYRYDKYQLELIKALYFGIGLILVLGLLLL